MRLGRQHFRKLRPKGTNPGLNRYSNNFKPCRLNFSSCWVAINKAPRRRPKQAEEVAEKAVPRPVAEVVKAAALPWVTAAVTTMAEQPQPITLEATTLVAEFKRPAEPRNLQQHLPSIHRL